MSFKDITGEKSGKFTVLSYSHREDKKHFWNCKCDCGNEIIISTGHFHHKGKHSNGCFKCGQSKRTKASHDRVYTLYVDSSKRRGIGFDLDINTFKKLIENPCYYCGVDYSIHYKNNKHSYKYNGIDRVDNNQHYHLDNCVTCCKQCNQAKHTMEVEDFIKWLNRIANYRKNKY